MKPNDVPLFDTGSFQRTVKLLTGDPGESIDSLREKPFCVAPGLLYAMARFDKSLIEAFKEETNCPDFAIKRYLTTWPLFRVEGTEFERLSASRELICLVNKELFEAFVDFCTSITVADRKRNKEWKVLAWNTPFPNRDEPMSSVWPVCTLCPLDEAKQLYYPTKLSPLDLSYTIIKSIYGKSEESRQN
jgi:hypothetical protein